MDDEERLQHFGVLGMHWGVHRGVRLLAKSMGKSHKNISVEEAKQFRNDIKQYKKSGTMGDYVTNPNTGITQVTQWYNSKNEKVGQKYVDAVWTEAYREQVVKSLLGTSIVIAGASVAGILLSKLNS